MAKLNIVKHEKMGYNPARNIDFYRVHFDIVGKTSTVSDYIVLYKNKDNSWEFGWFGSKDTDEIDTHWEGNLYCSLKKYAKENIK